MSFRELNLYYQYANCISETNNFYKKSLITKKFSPEEASNLQLLSISLQNSNDDSNEYFMLMKELLNIINSYSAQFSQTEFESLDYALIEEIIFVLYLLIKILESYYKELSDSHQQNLIMTQIEFILEGIPLLFLPNKELKSLNDVNNIDKEAILNRLNENESIVSNENYQAILKKALNM